MTTTILRPVACDAPRGVLRRIAAAAAILAATCTLSAQPRQEITLTDDWQFSRDRQQWQTVSVPHDWAISGPFDKQWDLQTVRIEQNGEKQATEKSGRSGALPWIGEGCYRRNVVLPQGYTHYELVFDGAMAEPRVFFNGHEAAYWPYGYNTFRADITPYAKEGTNLLEVSLNNVEESSRWYPGAGIYRPVTLVATGPTRLDRWQTVFRTTDIADGRATLAFETTVCTADTGAKGSAVGTGNDGRATVRLVLYDADGRKTAADEAKADGDGHAALTLNVAKARLWSPESPHLYKAVVTLLHNGKTIDEIEENIGLRTVSVSADGGFRLNGVSRKLKGVCLHHDLGPLGAAVNKAALIRQIRTMKEMGCDAIRTSHNMPSQMQMEVCDSLGMMVMAESFDMWIYAKCKNGYARFFKAWADKDIETLVRANRNHPSIVMWSIGNEIPEQGMKGGTEIARRLQDLCHRLHPTRPVTQGCDRPDNALKTGFLQVMDVPGLNYRLHRYQSTFDKLPQGFLLGSETASTVSSRGCYYFPVVPKATVTRPDGQCSGYDVEWCSWSNLPDDDWQWQDDKAWVIGEFVWTGYDYLGEPTPYDEYWPSRSSYFGICDLAGLPKDRYFLYRSHWQNDDQTLHLLPHWTWGEEREGEETPVYCYTTYPECELFVNGKSQGRMAKNPKERLDRYRLRWNDVRYEPGELRVVAYDEKGRKCDERMVMTAKAPTRIVLDTWTQHTDASPIANPATRPHAMTALPKGGKKKVRRKETTPTLWADGSDLAFITVSLTDENGTFCPTLTDQMTFSVEGDGTFVGVCNGDATSLEVFTEPHMRLFAGQLVVVVRAAKRAGSITLNVSDKDRNISSEVTINVIENMNGTQRRKDTKS